MILHKIPQSNDAEIYSINEEGKLEIVSMEFKVNLNENGANSL